MLNDCKDCKKSVKIQKQYDLDGKMLYLCIQCSKCDKNTVVYWNDNFDLDRNIEMVTKNWNGRNIGVKQILEDKPEKTSTPKLIKRKT